MQDDTHRGQIVKGLPYFFANTNVYYSLYFIVTLDIQVSKIYIYI